MSPEGPPNPDWAQQDRLRDIAWIKENLHVFVLAAQTDYREVGRGASLVDMTQQPVEGLGHPFGYFPQDYIEQSDDEDTKRMAREYVPEEEFVLKLYKHERRTSTYRLQAFQQVAGQAQNGNPHSEDGSYLPVVCRECECIHNRTNAPLRLV